MPDWPIPVVLKDAWLTIAGRLWFSSASSGHESADDLRLLCASEAAGTAWDDAYAPPGWNYERYGRPDVVFMELMEDALP